MRSTTVSFRSATYSAASNISSFLTGSSNDFFRLPTTPPPTPGASILQVDHGTPPQLNAATADYVLTARVGLIPEPSTWMMIGTGLLGLGAVAVGRGRRATPAPGPAARDGELPKEPLVG